VSPEQGTRVQMSPEAQNDIKMHIYDFLSNWFILGRDQKYALSGDCKRNVNYETRMKNSE
jgi:hypothetical protein